MTLSDLQGNSLTASLFKCNFPHTCAEVDKSSVTQSDKQSISVIAEVLLSQVIYVVWYR